MTDDTMSIALYRERSATDVINATFRFLRAQFGPLAKGLFLLAGPPLILANVASMFVTGMSAATLDASAVGLLLVQGVGTLFGTVIAMTVAISAVQIAHVEGSSALTTRRLWEAVRTHGLSLFGRLLQIVLVCGVGGVVLGVVIGGVAGGIGGTLGTVLTVLLSLLALGGFLYVAPAFTLLFAGQVDAERSISLSRCVTLMKGRWGQTVGVWLLASMINGILFSIGWIPKVVMTVLVAGGATVTGTVGLVLAGTIAGVASTLAPAIVNTATTLQYYNLVEQKEQVSLNEDVGRMEQAMGSATADANTAEAGTAGGPSAAKDESGSGEAVVESESSSSESDPTDDRRWQGGESDR
jgi:hypothetical protein